MKNLFILLFVLVSFSSSLFSQATTTEWLKLDNELFSIKYPSHWKADESGQFGVKFMINSPKDFEEDKFSENVNLTIQDLSGYNLSFEDYITISIEQIENMMANSKITVNETLRAHDRKYHKVVYTSTQEALHLEFEQYFWVVGNEAYLLTFTCESHKSAAYKTLRDQMMASFVLK